MSSPSFRQLPAVAAIKEVPQIAELAATLGERFVTECIRSEIARARDAMRTNGGEPATVEAIVAAVLHQADRASAPPLTPVLNATGVIVHTNLGRAPLAAEAIEAIAAAATDATPLEYDLTTGARGSRHAHVEDVLCELTGAEAAACVNNNAAAVLLALDTLAKNREVVVSRGEMVEIGGSFRVPDVITSTGARLIEVGTTNKTKIADFENAITEDTAVLMKVHASNFRIVGFTAAATREELVALAHDRGLRVVEDLGSGALIDLQPAGIHDEPLVQDSVGAGIDVVTFSGDKLLGGPQAGLLVGKHDAIAAIKNNPLMRALRPDKITLAALVTTLQLYRNPMAAKQRIPVLAAIHRPLENVRAQAEHVAEDLANIPALSATVIDSDATVGGGAAPGLTLPSAAVALRSERHSPDGLAAALRAQPVPVVGYIARDAVHLDQRTVPTERVADLIRTVRAAVS